MIEDKCRISYCFMLIRVWLTQIQGLVHLHVINDHKFSLDRGMDLVCVVHYGTVSIGKLPSSHNIIKISICPWPSLWGIGFFRSHMHSLLLRLFSWVAGDTTLIIKTDRGEHFVLNS